MQALGWGILAAIISLVLMVSTTVDEDRILILSFLIGLAVTLIMWGKV